MITRSKVLIMLFLSFKTIDLVPKSVPTTLNTRSNHYYRISIYWKKTFDLVPKHTFDLVKFDLLTPTREIHHFLYLYNSRPLFCLASKCFVSVFFYTSLTSIISLAFVSEKNMPSFFLSFFIHHFLCTKPIFDAWSRRNLC